MHSLFDNCEICRKKRWELIVLFLMITVTATGCRTIGKTEMRFSNVVKAAPHGDAPSEPLFSAITSVEDWEKVDKG